MTRPTEGRLAISTFIRANHKIRVPSVQCVDTNGKMLGIIPTREARAMAAEQGLDLVEVAPNANPPVCRIMNLGKYRYELRRKERQARKHQHSAVVKEMKFHANVEQHDYETKLNHIKEFLEKGFKVKLMLTFRGRENIYRDIGFEVIRRVIKDCVELSAVSMGPLLMGRNIIAMLSAKGTGSKQQAPSAGQPVVDTVAAEM